MQSKLLLRLYAGNIISPICVLVKLSLERERGIGSIAWPAD